MLWADCVLCKYCRSYRIMLLQLIVRRSEIFKCLFYQDLILLKTKAWRGECEGWVFLQIQLVLLVYFDLMLDRWILTTISIFVGRILTTWTVRRRARRVRIPSQTSDSIWKLPGVSIFVGVTRTGYHWGKEVLAQLAGIWFITIGYPHAIIIPEEEIDKVCYPYWRKEIDTIIIVLIDTIIIVLDNLNYA